MADTKELQVNGANDNNHLSATNGEAPRASDVYKKHGRHAKTESLQMLQSHAVEEELLTEMCFGKFIVKCPFLLCAIMIFIIFIVIVIDAQVFEISDQNNRTFLVEDNKYVEAFDAYNLAGQFIADNGEENVTVLPQTEANDFWIYQHMFTLKDYKGDFNIDDPDSTDYWILTPENIKTIIKYENYIVEDPEWKNRFCYVGADPISTNYSCEPAISSVARQIYNEDNFDNMTTEDIREWVDLRADYLAFFFNPGLKETGQTYVYRSFFSAGNPIATEWETENGTTIHETEYQNALDRADEQSTEYVDWAVVLFKDVTVDNNGDLVDGDLNIITVSWVVYNRYFNVILNESMVYLGFAVVIVLVYMSIHLGSIFLSFCALIQILMSFPLAYFFYRIVFQIPHYDTLSSLIIFVLLGVGADDVFVFTDAWLQSVHFLKDVGGLDIPNEGDSCWQNDKVSCIRKDTKRLILRMSFAFRRAAKAMLVTQVTTFFAFLATATSQIMPIAAFGIWASLIVAMNYVLVITLYPAILIFHHAFIKRFESACLCCICNLCGKARSNRGNNDEPVPKDAPSPSPDGDVDGNMMPQIVRQLSEEEQQAEEYRCFEQFLGRKWSKFIMKCKVFILIIFAIIFIFAAILGSQMEAQSEDERWFADEHFMQKSQDKLSEFSASETDDIVQIKIAFGIEGVNRDGYTRWDPEEYGVVVWDSTFDISSTEAQNALMDICNKTRNSSLVYAPDLVTCPIEDFKAYVESIGETFPYESGSGKKSFEETYFDYMSSPYATLGALTFVEKDEESGNYEIRFYAMDIYTTITWSAASDESREYRGEWDTFIDDFSVDCPESVCHSVTNVALRWCWLVTQRAFVQSAIQGILIAMPLAFCILLLSTTNWLISIFAVIDIIGIMLCELSIMQIQGWKFGVSECVAIVIIIGFSVDYVVHLANAYLESTAKDRQGRLSFSLLTMGISVVSGAITTFAAGFFLIFPEIVFFYKMGILMMTTVAVSILWAMMFFTSIVALWGPQNDTGDLKKYFKCCPCYKKSHAQDQETTKQRVQSESVAPHQKQNTNLTTPSTTTPNGGHRDSYANYTVDDVEKKPYELEMGLHVD